MSSFDRSDILRTFQLFHNTGDVIELRIPKAGRYKTISGYFNEAGVWADSIVALADEDFAGYYFTINPCNPALIARSANKYTKYAKETTADADITKRQWLPIDLDPIRPAGISSNEEEHAAALQKARDIREWLISRGWPAGAFILADSGNGGHLAAKIDLPNDEAARDLVKSCLEALDTTFSDDKTKVDTTTYNAARIWKIYGTSARKGSDTPDRPHRVAKIIDAPDELAIVSGEQLETLAAIKANPKERHTENSCRVGGADFDPVKYAEEHGSDVLRTKPWHGGILATLAVCPFNADHDRGEAFLGVQASGARYFACKHESCKGNDWHALKDLWGSPKGNGNKREGSTLQEAIEKIKSDARALKDSAILATLTDLKSNDPIEFDLTVDEIKRAHRGLKVDTIREMVDKYILESKEARKAPRETSEAVKEKALAIAERGDPLRYLVWQAQRNHLGDIDYQKVLIASIASAASKKSNGIQPGGNGDKGSGKSDACESVYHLVPTDRRLDGSLSPMSLFYLQQTGRIQAGMVLHSDDVEYEPIIPIYKRSTAGFQKSTTHFSVTSGKNREAIELTIPPRIVWWLTSVESVANEQAFDRQYPISTDSSPGHKQRVANEIAARRARKELKLEEDEGIAVARAILADVFDNGPFMVVIPQAEKAKWLKVSDFRGQEQFWDMVDALVILRWRQRKRDQDGWLIADDQDLIEAKEIHSGHKAAHYADLTDAEVKIVGVMSDGMPRSQGQLTEALGVAQSTLSERLRSIMAKSPLITEEYEHGRKTYTINTKAEKLGGDYWNGLDLIDLGISSKEAYRSQQIALSVCYRYVIGLPIGVVINNSKRIPTTLSVNKEESTKRGCTCDDCGRCPLKECLSSIHSTDKTTDNVQKQQQEPLSDTDKSDRYDPISTDKAHKRPSDIPIRHTSDPIDPGPSIDMPTPGKPEDPAKKIKAAAITEYGINGWVDPRKITDALKLPAEEVAAWLDANYYRYTRTDGSTGYTQRPSEAGA